MCIVIIAHKEVTIEFQDEERFHGTEVLNINSFAMLRNYTMTLLEPVYHLTPNESKYILDY